MERVRTVKRHRDVLVHVQELDYRKREDRVLRDIRKSFQGKHSFSHGNDARRMVASILIGIAITVYLQADIVPDGDDASWPITGGQHTGVNVGVMVETDERHSIIINGCWILKLRAEANDNASNSFPTDLCRMAHFGRPAVHWPIAGSDSNRRANSDYLSKFIKFC